MRNAALGEEAARILAATGWRMHRRVALGAMRALLHHDECAGDGAEIARDCYLGSSRPRNDAADTAFLGVRRVPRFIGAEGMSDSRVPALMQLVRYKEDIRSMRGKTMVGPVAATDLHAPRPIGKGCNG